MSSGERDSPNFGFLYLLCYLFGCCNISAMAGLEILTPGVKSAADSRYYERKDVLDPPNQTTFKNKRKAAVS